jgi:PAS domain S-box-containing protein
MGFQPVEEVRERLLRNTFDTLSLVTDTLPVAVMIIDRNGMGVHINGEAARATGYSLEEFLDSWDMSRDMAMDGARGTPAERTAGGRPYTERELRLRCKDGSTRHVHARTMFLPDDTLLVTWTDGNDHGSAGEEPDAARTAQRLLIENIPDAVVILDLAGNVTAYNNTFLRLFGVTGKDAREGALLTKALSSEESRQWLGKIVERAPETRGPFQAQWGIRKHDGTPVDVEVTTSPVKGPDRAIAGYIAQVRQLPQGGAAPEEERREVEGNFALLAEKSLSLTGVFLVQDGVFRYANPRFTEVFGYRAEELVDRVRLRDLVVPEQWHTINKELSKLLSHDDAGLVHTEFKGIARNRQPVYAELYCCSTTVSGRPAVVGTLVDITKWKVAEDRLRKAEEKYRAIFENSVLGICQMTAEGEFISANQALAHIHGYSSPDELMTAVTDTGRQLYVDEDKKGEFWQQLREHGSVEAFEAEMRKKDGSQNWVSLSAHAVRDDHNNILYFEGIVQDITERKKLESQLMESQKMEAIGTLAGGVAHDFNNLLMGIQGYTSLMLFNLNATDQHYERLKSIEQLVRSGADLTKQLLGFARAGRYQVKVTNLTDLLKNMAAIFIRTKKEITVREEYQEDLYPVDADQSQLEQAFLNLFVNAWQAMPGGGHLGIEARNVVLDRVSAKSFSVPAGKYVKVSVTDSGIGMDERTMKRIFEPFFTTKEMGRGAGLGLATVYGIVKGHKGVINVYSEVGHGTTFNVYLPASRKGLRVVEPIEVPEKLVKGAETVLIIDDEEMIIKVSREILEALGYNVITALSGREGVEAYGRRKDEIDLVILDMIMPDMEGAKAFEELKVINPAVKVLLCSGYTLNNEAEAILARGCKAFMQKPFNIQSLSVKVREVLEEG